MTKKIVGVFATVALLSSGVALAGGEKHQKAQSSQQQGSEATGGAGQMLGEKQISGTVLKSSNSEIKLRTDNGVISVKIDKNTQFQDTNVKHIKDLKEGQQVRTSFTVEKDANLAKSVSLDTNMGGSGLDTDKGINQDLGGSGVDQKGSQDMGGQTHPEGKTY